MNVKTIAGINESQQSRMSPFQTGGVADGVLRIMNLVPSVSQRWIRPLSDVVAVGSRRCLREAKIET